MIKQREELMTPKQLAYAQEGLQDRINEIVRQAKMRSFWNRHNVPRKGKISDEMVKRMKEELDIE